MQCLQKEAFIYTFIFPFHLCDRFPARFITSWNHGGWSPRGFFHHWIICSWSLGNYANKSHCSSTPTVAYSNQMYRTIFWILILSDKRGIIYKEIPLVTVPCKKTRFCGHSLCKWGHFERAKPTLKMLLASWFLIFKRFRSLNNENLGSVGQRAERLPAIKLWEWFDRGQTQIRADWFEWG